MNKLVKYHLLTSLLVPLILLTGCGQQGPLVLPDKAVTNDKPTVTPPSQATTEQGQ